MIKTLQKRFVVTAMIAVSVLLVVMLGVINIWNIGSTESQIKTTFAVLSDEKAHGQLNAPDEERPGFNGLANDKNLFMSADYFYVILDPDGNIKDTQVTNIALISEAEAEAYANQAYEQSDETGKIKNLRYQFFYDPSELDMKVIFLNTSQQSLFCIRVLLLSLVSGFVGWLLMLVFVICLSKKMILPIAENIDKQKRFITNAGHEIKTPLAIILSNTDAMELYNGENKWSKNIRAQINRLNGLMQNLLLLAKQDERKEQTITEPVDISEIAVQSLTYYSEMMNLKNVTVNQQIETGIMVKANKESAIQLFSILLDNASKYVNDNGHFALSVQRVSGKLQIRCSNTCDTLPEGDLNHLFDRFYRGDEARTQKSGGYGIGLSVAQSIVQSLHGTISAKAEDNMVVFIILI